MRLMQVALTILLLFGIASAAPLDLMPIVPAIALVVAIFLAIMFAFSGMLSSPTMAAWTKSELRELVAGVLLVLIIYSLFVTSRGVSSALTGQEDYIGTSVSVIDNMINNETGGYDTAFKYVIKAATKIRIGASYSPYLTIPIWYFSLMYSTSPLSGVSIMLTALGSATQGLTNVIFIYESLRLLIMFFDATVPSIILPLAFAVRLIPFTRKTGNTLIAVALAAIVLLPFSVILAGEVNKLIEYPDVTIHNISRLDAHPFAMEASSIFCGIKPLRFILTLTDYGFAALVCLPLLLVPIVGAGLFAACYPLVSEVVYPIIMLVVKLVQLILSVIWIAWAEIEIGTTGGFGGSGWPGKVFDIIMPFLQNVNNVVLVGYLDFILIAIITISGARAISTALGGEWYLAGVERLI
ncbi:hypothetical protein H0O02_04460 [Candidatus Micrarchaeota archaeon]|nr:hypothetical protein [Candidatus Micrarchaeota archaeon]